MLRAAAAEALGTCFLLIGVVGSGIMGANLADGNVALALLANAVATGCILYCIITTLAPVSGAHFNPVVSLYFWIRGELPSPALLAYLPAQILGGVLGVFLTHMMFGLSIIQTSTTPRNGVGQWGSEAIATFGLLFVIVGGLKSQAEAVPTLVALYITGAYWFTSSTSFANPAVTIARGFTDTFAGISPGDVLPFILMQFVGLGVAALTLKRIFD